MVGSVFSDTSAIGIRRNRVRSRPLTMRRPAAGRVVLRRLASSWLGSVVGRGSVLRRYQGAERLGDEVVAHSRPDPCRLVAMYSSRDAPPSWSR